MKPNRPIRGSAVSALGLMALAAVLIAACGQRAAVPTQQGSESTAVRSDGEEFANAPTVEPLQLGPVDEFSQGINELERPRRMFVVVAGNEVIGFDRTDPNNGCVLFAVDEAAETFEFDDPDASFFDQCHGNTYDIAGQPLHCSESRALRSIEILVEDGIAKWAGLMVDPDEPDARSAPQCPTP